MYKNVACIGAGNVGRSWAIVFAAAGCNVTVFDSSPDFSATTFFDIVNQSVAALADAGLTKPDQDIAKRITIAASLQAAVDGADYVQESVAEDVAVKQDVFKKIENAARADVIVASSTSAIPAHLFTEHLVRRERMLVVHPVNPPHLIPLVEICPAPWTSPSVVAQVEAFMRAVGQAPIILRKAVTGFVLNRLQFALFGEAMHLIAQGVCSASDIDSVMKNGLARRWALYGPFEVVHLNAAQGFRGFIKNLGAMIRSITSDVRPDYPWTDSLIETVHREKCIMAPEDEILDHQLRRDKAVIALKRFLQAQQI